LGYSAIQCPLRSKAALAFAGLLGAIAGCASSAREILVSDKIIFTDVLERRRGPSGR
jgi:hypothetical protein